MFGILAFATIFAVGVSGVFVHAWTIPVGVAILAAISAFENRELNRRAYYGSQASQGFAIATFGASIINGMIVCGVAFVLGAIVGTTM